MICKAFLMALLGYCKLDQHPSANYHCLNVDFLGNVLGSRPCNAYEPPDTVVIPECNTPIYYYPGKLRNMECNYGRWNYIAICSSECGRITPEGRGLIFNGTSVKRGKLPWHAGIYRKNTTPYMQICGGSLVSTTVVISAAHCFWDVWEEKVYPASMYAVAVGKLYRPWNDPHDVDAQKSDVSYIAIPSRFQGVAGNYQSDIALLLMKFSFEFTYYVRPVCLDFDPQLEKSQLKAYTRGKVAGWGLISQNGKTSPVLKVIDMPLVPINTCITESPPDFREFITNDKICAGWGKKGTGAVCRGDSGGGFVFSEIDDGNDRYYLRGIVSTAPDNDHRCNIFSFTAFTKITQHMTFILWGEQI